MSEEEKFIRIKIKECTRIIEASSYIGNKKAYAKERTQLKCVLNLIQKQQAELEKKDKIIEKMAEFIAGLDIDEDICSKLNKDCDQMAYGECENCIKQYFEGRAKND